MSNSTIQINYPSPKRYVHTQTEPSSYWSVKHNFGYKYCVVTVANSASEVLIPSSIELYDNGLGITFDDENPQSGYAIVTGIDYGLGSYRKITKTIIEKNSDYTITLDDDKTIFVSETSTSQRFYLPDTSTVSGGFTTNISKIGTGHVFIEPTSAATIENGPSGSYIVAATENQSYISLMKISDNLWSRIGSWNWTSIIYDGLVLYLDAGNPNSYPGSGTTWYDLSGKGYNGTLVNGPTYSSVNNGVIVLDGVNDYINVPINLTNTTYTIMGASRYVTVTNGRTFSGQNNNWLMGHWNNSTSKHYAGGWVTSSTASQFPNTNWAIYTATGNHSADIWSFYINSALYVSNNGGSNGPDGLAIGSYMTTSEFSNSHIGFVLAYNRVLSSTEILQNYNALKGRYGLS